MTIRSANLGGLVLIAPAKTVISDLTRIEVRMKKILITNDDGIYADGLIRLATAAKKFGEVYIVAPHDQRSAVSHSITLRHSFEAWKEDFPVEGVHAYACNGTPADCIRIGVLNIVKGKPDYIFSGINYGFNAASDLQYSATVGAAFEGAFQNLPSIAFSEDATECHEIADHYLHSVIEELLKKAPGKNYIWNVNFPGCHLSECGGILRNRSVSAAEFFIDCYHETALPNGHTSYMVEGIRNYTAEEGSDLHAIFNNYVSIGKVKNFM